MTPKEPNTNKPDPSKPDVKADIAAAAAAVAESFGEGGEKKKKRKYSRGLKELQRGERKIAKAGRRFGRAIASGLETYYDRDIASSYKKRDGAIRDALKNWTKGLEKAAKKSSGIPYDIAKAFDTKTMRRNIRTAIRFLAPPFLR